MCIKTLAIFKHQQFDDSKSEKMAPIGYKDYWLDKRDDEERQKLDKNEDDGDRNRYVPLSLMALLLSPQKKSNRLSNLGKKTKSLTHLVCIPKNC